MDKALIYDYDLEDFEHLVSDWGLPRYRARQIWEGLYKSLWQDASEFAILPRTLQQALEAHFTFKSLKPAGMLKSKDDGTIKTSFAMHDNQVIEAVLMRYSRRRTLCISTQAGCAMGCVFCATGQMGFRRHLRSGEIVEQVLYYARQLKMLGEHVTNVVVMGMGEPFHNYDATLQSVDRLNHPLGFNLGARRFTISTVGIIPGIQRFSSEGRQVNLAVSLHAADDELRNSMLPINRKYPLENLIAACKEYVDLTGRRISFEWALIQGVNDSSEQAKKLANLLQVFRIRGASMCHVNVILLNPTNNYRGLAASRAQAMIFQSELELHGIPCTMRLRRGIEIQAGCGQLAVGQNKV